MNKKKNTSKKQTKNTKIRTKTEIKKQIKKASPKKSTVLSSREINRARLIALRRRLAQKRRTGVFLKKKRVCPARRIAA